MTIKTKNHGSTRAILNTSEAANLINVTPQTIKNYIYSGKLRAIKTPGGHHRIWRTDLENLGFSAEKERDPNCFSRDELLSSYNILFKALIKTVESLVSALDTRDIISSGHSARVAEMSCNVGRVMGLSESQLQQLKLSALLHDVGKIGISETILGKPGQLTDQEYFLVKKHSEIGEKIVSEIEYLKPIALSVRHCHERFDGNGYPDGVSGTDIDINARITAVTDTYDFLRSDLCFRLPLAASEALQEIQNCSGSQFDPDVVKIFVDTINTGSLSLH